MDLFHELMAETAILDLWRYVILHTGVSDPDIAIRVANMCVRDKIKDIFKLKKL